MNELDRKKGKLAAIVKKTGGLVVAFSGGLDSTLLAAVARCELGDMAIAVTALSPTYPAHEQSEAQELARIIGIRHELIVSNELEIAGFADNPRERCYFCKGELFSILKGVAKNHGLKYVADGTNVDDLSDHRPGRRAAKEHGVISPLLEAGMTKEDIRQVSREMGLPTSEKPAFACLASRFPYGTKITGEKLKAVDEVEAAVRKLGFAQVRVRHHGDTARIEVEPRHIKRLAEDDVRKEVVAAAKKAGFVYVAVDLEGYRTGSMNEAKDE